MMNKNSFLFVLVLIILTGIFSCKNDIDKEINTNEFLLQKGFDIELVAAEPLLNAPVAMAFDLKGRIWVVELPGYMRDIDGSDENFPDGKIVILEDTDSDGQMDNRRIFLDSLITPRALAFAYNGLLYTESTNLWWIGLEGEEKGEKELVDSLYVIGGNIEHQPNGLLYNLDNWIYSAKSNARYRKKEGKWLKEATTFRGQWGITNDEEGRLFYNDNSNPLFGDFTMPNQLIDNPFQQVEYGVNQTITMDRRLYPYQATAVNRGYEKGVLDGGDKLKYFTSACGPLFYKGHQFSKQNQNIAFVCAPEANLIKQYQIETSDARISAQPVYTSSEFLISKEESFRPVNLYTGLDGALYILDMRKGIIQHRAYMTSYLREKILGKGLEKIVGKGRVYKVFSTKHKLVKAPDFSQFTTSDFIDLLQHPNGELRSKAQQALVFQGDVTIYPLLKHIALDTTNPYGQIHALWTLEGLDLLRAEMLEEVGRTAKHDFVLSQALQLTELFPEAFSSFAPLFNKAISMESAKVDLQLSHSIGKWEGEKAKSSWLKLAKKYRNDPLYCEALISGIAGKEETILDELGIDFAGDTIFNFLQSTLKNKRDHLVQTPQLLQGTFEDDRTAGFRLYNTYCASCHGLDGKGNAQLAPPLLQSEYLTGSADKLVLLTLHGLKGPIQVNGKQYNLNVVMPGVKNNPELTDKAIADILTFVRNSFSYGTNPINENQVRQIRIKSKDRTSLFTEKELKDW